MFFTTLLPPAFDVFVICICFSWNSNSALYFSFSFCSLYWSLIPGLVISVNHSSIFITCMLSMLPRTRCIPLELQSGRYTPLPFFIKKLLLYILFNPWIFLLYQHWSSLLTRDAFIYILVVSANWTSHHYIHSWCLFALSSNK